jgi:tight adherence protein C
MEHPILFSACAFLMLMVLMSWVGYRLAYKPGRFMRQLGTPVISGEYAGGMAEEPGAQPKPLVTFLQQIGSKVPASEADVATLRTDLIRAGYRSEHALAVFFGIRIVSTLTMLVICLMMTARLENIGVLGVAVVGFGCVAGWILPRMFLERRVKGRQETVRLSLPDALDLLVVSIEAGLGLDMAMQHVARELQVTHPELSEDLSLVTLEMRAGKRRSDALRNFAERTGEPEVRKLVAILIQSDRFGTSMGESLRTHSDFMRTKRRQDAEERANKVGVKLVFPIFFFILPSMLTVAAGPGVLQIVKDLFPMMRGLAH